MVDMKRRTLTQLTGVPKSRRMAWLHAALSALLLGLQTVVPARAAETARVTVDAGRVLGPVNPLVFGHGVVAADSQFIFTPRSNPIPGRTGGGVWDPAARRPVPEVVDAARAIGMQMVRYPGGCLGHNFDWHRVVGPLEERPDYTFGIDEFIAFCRAVGAEPLMTTSDYVGGPQDMADLVEYCNAPATDAHPWAMKRAQWGNPKPYGIRYWEMGNESDHGNHDVKPFRKHTGESYADWFLESARLMRKVDPTLRIGALMGTGSGPSGPDDPWNRIVLTRAGKEIDFVIVHTYAVSVWKEPTDVNLALQAAMAAGDQFEEMLAKYRTLIRECVGKDVPLAITEYNAAYVQEKPAPYRFSMAAALFSADYVRILLKPESNVLMANYWQFINSYWGMLRGPIPGVSHAPWKRMAAYHCYRLWGQHTGTRLLAVEVESPRVDFDGYGKTAATSRDAKGYEVTIQTRPGGHKGCRWETASERELRLELAGVEGNRYLPFAHAVAPEKRAVKLSFEARVTGNLPAGVRLGIGMIDGRGWEATKSGFGIDSLASERDRWVAFNDTLNTLPGCRAIDIIWRVVGAQPAISVAVEIRKLRLDVLPARPPYAAVTACATLSEDGRTLYLMLFNKHHTDDQDVAIDLKGFPTSGGRLWQVTAPSLASMNVKHEEVAQTQSGVAVPVAGSRASLRLPKVSMTAVEFTRGS